jgi:hypothetical protein
MKMKFENKLTIKGIVCVTSKNEEAAIHQKMSDIAYDAAKKLFDYLGWDKNEIRTLFLVTQSSDYVIPSTASLLHKRLQFGKECLLLDFNLGGNGFGQSLQITGQVLQQMGIGSRGFVVLGETRSDGSIKLAAAVALECEADSAIRGESVMIPQSYHMIQQVEKYTSTEYNHNYLEIAQNQIEDMIENIPFEKDVIALTNEESIGYLIQEKNSECIQKCMEHAGIVKAWKDNSALIPYLICLIGNAKQYVTVSLGAGMVLSSLAFNISSDTLLSIEETEELYYDLKEDEYEQFGKV